MFKVDWNISDVAEVNITLKDELVDMDIIKDIVELKSKIKKKYKRSDE